MGDTAPESKPLGLVTESTEDRLKCIALQLGITQEAAAGWALGIGMTVLELSADMPEARLWLWDGGMQGHRISMPGKPGEV